MAHTPRVMPKLCKLQTLTQLVPLHLTLADGSRHDVMVKLADLREDSYAAAGKGESFERAVRSFQAEAAFYKYCAPRLEQVTNYGNQCTYNLNFQHFPRSRLAIMSPCLNLRP